MRSWHAIDQLEVGISVVYIILTEKDRNSIRCTRS